MNATTGHFSLRIRQEDADKDTLWRAQLLTKDGAVIFQTTSRSKRLIQEAASEAINDLSYELMALAREARKPDMAVINGKLTEI